MAEYIEREAAKRAIVEVVDSGMATTSEDLAEVIDEIPAAKWRWIPVEEALPAGSDGRSLCDNVIACTVEGEVCTGWLKGDTWHLLVGLDDRITRHGRGYVTHWMPLPEGPATRREREKMDQTWMERLEKKCLFRGRTPEGKVVYGALVPEGSLDLKGIPGVPPAVTWHMVQRDVINRVTQVRDEVVELTTVEICLGWTDREGRGVYLPLGMLALALEELAAYVRVETAPEDEAAVLEAKNELLAQENDRLKAENKRLQRENFWLTGGGIGRAGQCPTPTEVRGDE